MIAVRSRQLHIDAPPPFAYLPVVRDRGLRDQLGLCQSRVRSRFRLNFLILSAGTLGVNDLFVRLTKCLVHRTRYAPTKLNRGMGVPHTSLHFHSYW